MKRYIWRTSLVWMLLVAAGMWAWQAHLHGPHGGAMSRVGDVAPVAAGPTSEIAQKTKDTAVAAAPGPVQLTPEQMQTIGVETGTVGYKQLDDAMRATGTVAVDERLLSAVQVRFPGYIRRVFADATYEYVRKGEPLFTVYSPELVATQEEYLLARKNEKALQGSTVDGVAAGAASLADAAERRLAQWNVPASEMARLQRTGTAIRDLTINSPVSGYITERNALPNQYVEPSTRLYTVADLSQVWVNAEVFQDEIGRLKPGDEAVVTVDAYPGRRFTGRIEQILPQVEMATRTVPVRMAISNPGLRLKPGMFVNVELRSNLGRELVVPASAVLQTGTQATVFLNRGGGRLEPKEIEVGMRVGEDLVVLKGLSAGQSVVTSANFLIDSESQLQAAAGAFEPPPPGAGSGTTNAGSAAAAQVDFTSVPDPPTRGENVFRVRLTGQGMVAVTGAQVTVTWYMAAMPAMGMAARKSAMTLPEKGDGEYEGSGMLSSGGTWQVTIVAERDGRTLATRQLRVNVTGGM